MCNCSENFQYKTNSWPEWLFIFAQHFGLGKYTGWNQTQAAGNTFEQLNCKDTDFSIQNIIYGMSKILKQQSPWTQNFDWHTLFPVDGSLHYFLLKAIQVTSEKWWLRTCKSRYIFQCTGVLVCKSQSGSEENSSNNFWLNVSQYSLHLVSIEQSKKMLLDQGYWMTLQQHRQWPLGSGPRYMMCVTHFCTLRESKNLRPCDNSGWFLHGSRFFY